MKIITSLIMLTLITTSCTRSVNIDTKELPCVGLMDTKDPTMEYELSWANLAIAALLSETIIVPVLVAAKYLECPVHKK